MTKTRKRRIRPLRILLVACIFFFLLNALISLGITLIRTFHLSYSESTPVPEEPVQEVYVDPVYMNAYDFDKYTFVNQYLTYNDDQYTYEVGVDVSTHQKNINWETLKNTGIDFIFLRVGYRGYETGLINADSRFNERITMANTYKIPVGVYFFSQAISEEEAVEEADYVLEKIREHHVEYPIAFDMEDASDHDRIRDMTAEDCTRVAVAFARRIREAGYEPIIYGSASWLESRIFMEEIQDICGFWVASYNTSRLPMIHDYKIWQYSSQGEVPGIDGIVDLNIYMKKK